MNDENVLSMKPSASVVVVTPEMAARWLSKNQKNRNIRQAAVSSYARDMASGNWQLTGEAVKFDRSGNLIDGQHRLMAIIKSDVPVTMFVVRGLPAGAQDVMDSGAKRQAADALHLSGHKNATTVAATARLALSLEANGNDTRHANKAFTNSEIAEWVTKNPGVEDAAAAAMNLRNFVDISPSVIALSWLTFSNIDADACLEFWTSIGNNSTDGPGDPRNTLIRRVASARRASERLNQVTQLSFVTRAWNAWRKGASLSILRDRSSNGRGGSTAVSIPKAV